MKTIRENLLVLQALIESTPAQGVDLDSYSTKCGSIHCTLGWAAQSEAFPGITADYHGNVQYYGQGSSEGIRNGLFGQDAFMNVFACFGEGEFDNDIFEEYPALTYEEGHKALALARIARQLEQYP